MGDVVGFGPVVAVVDIEPQSRPPLLGPSRQPPVTA
jgi:hypothetical protein